MKHTYREVGRGLNNNGWFVIWLLNLKTTKVVGVNRKRFVTLKNAGRIVA